MATDDMQYYMKDSLESFKVHDQGEKRSIKLLYVLLKKITRGLM